MGNFKVGIAVVTFNVIETIFYFRTNKISRVATTGHEVVMKKYLIKRKRSM